MLLSYHTLSPRTSSRPRETHIGYLQWHLISRPHDRPTIGAKWIFKNKLDVSGNVIRNKVRLVAQGYTQIESISFEETFAPVAWLEAIRMALAFASFKDFKLF